MSRDAAHCYRMAAARLCLFFWELSIEMLYMLLKIELFSCYLLFGLMVYFVAVSHQVYDLQIFIMVSLFLFAFALYHPSRRA